PGAGANTALSNLAAVAINSALLPGVANTIALGSHLFPFSTLDLAGNSQQQTPVSNAIANSPTVVIGGVAQTGASTWAADQWTIQDILQAATINGTSTLTFTHSGTSGVSSVSIPILTLGSPLAVGSGGTGATSLANANIMVVSSAFTAGQIGRNTTGTNTFQPSQLDDDATLANTLTYNDS